MPDVRFGSKADMCAAKRHVCFTPNSDRRSEIPQQGMSALPPKADMCSARGHVCYGPIADIAHERAAPTREAAFASLKAPLRPVPAPVDPMDGSEEPEASGRGRILRYDNRKTTARAAQSS